MYQEYNYKTYIIVYKTKRNTFDMKLKISVTKHRRE